MFSYHICVNNIKLPRFSDPLYVYSLTLLSYYTTHPSVYLAYFLIHQLDLWLNPISY
jgi:hypothetical protein